MEHIKSAKETLSADKVSFAVKLLDLRVEFLASLLKRLLVGRLSGVPAVGVHVGKNIRLNAVLIIQNVQKSAAKLL
ncbi:MAG: hypothetical protein RRY64_09565, partial [Oscillospiraceae bacterium]